VPTPTAARVADLASLVGRGGVAVLTGAGISTESGIPDYRGPTGQARRTAPMTGQLFRDDPLARRRYWARGLLGWATIRGAQPNAGHRAVAQLQHAGLVDGVITQNVDGLHEAAGSPGVIDLHGRLDRVVCLSCATTTSRDHLQQRLRHANPGFDAEVLAVNADGDVDLPDDAVAHFVVVACEACGGVLKPDVVYFGENVPADRVADSYERVDDALALLVLGSSLHVFSGRRFVVRAAQRGMPVAIVNDGPTRGDDVAAIKLERPLGATLTTLVDLLG
jgi:NAD-dependent SIR2 family protein deacetylase